MHPISPGHGKTPRNRASSFVNPIQGFNLGRQDAGVDAGASVGKPIRAPAASRLVQVIPNWFSGQPLLLFQYLQRQPLLSQFWYVAEQIKPKSTKIGTTYQAGDPVATFASSGTGIEIGEGSPSSNARTLAGQMGAHPGDAPGPWSAEFLNKVIKGGAARGSRAPAGTGVSGWKVKASQESDGGTGSCGPIGSGGVWYSELSTVPMGAGSDFHALGGLPCGTALLITNPSNGKSVTAHKRDVGAGSSFLPVMGLYPATARALGLSGGVYTVIISRPDGGHLHPVRGTQVSGASAPNVTPRSRPGGQPPADTGQGVDQIFSDYEAKLNLPRTAPISTFSGISGLKTPFQWWWQSFSGQYAKAQGK